MSYLVTLLKHRWVFVALSIMIACLASFHSVKLFLFICLIAIWMYIIHIPKQVIGAIIILTISVYLYTEYRQVDTKWTLPMEVKWTDTYKINGETLRGFVKCNGTKYYVVYTFSSEEEKEQFTNKPVAGRTFIIEGAEIDDKESKSHPYSFSMDTYLKSHLAVGTLNIVEWYEIERDKTIMDILYGYRFRLNEFIVKHFPESLVAEAQALLFGEQELVNEDVARAYQKLGITHLFAISGLHIALVSLMFFQGLIRLKIRREIATVVLLVVLPLYAILAGGAPSVWRAVCVVEIVLLCRYFNWRVPIDDALAICFICFILIQPGLIFQIGFQLSFLATVAIVYSSPLLGRMKTWWSQSLMMTFVCQLLVYPLLLHHFFEFSLSSFIVNMFFVPLFSFIILPINFVLFIIAYVSEPFVNILFELYEPARMILQEFIMFIQTVPYQMWVPGRPSTIWMFVLYLGVFMAFYFLMKDRIKTAVICIILPAALFHFRDVLDQDMHISFIDVGQGDSILIEYPAKEKVYLIDTGGLLRFETETWKTRKSLYEVGKQIVVPYLKGRGIDKLDALIITHADADHVEGAEEIVKEIRVDEIHITPGSFEKEAMKDLLLEASTHGIPIKEKMAGDEVTKGLQYIWPTETNYEGNNDSLVLKLTYNGFTALFTGDLEELGENVLVKDKTAEIANMTVLKAGHHGSKTSSSESFIDAVNPKLVIFSAGEENRFGHPHAEVVDRFVSRDIPYIVTGEHGTIELTVHADDVSINVTR